MIRSAFMLAAMAMVFSAGVVQAQSSGETDGFAGVMRLSWIPPSSYVDGSPLNAGDIAGYEIWVQVLANGEEFVQILHDGSATSHELSLPEGIYSVSMTTIAADGQRSKRSNSLLTSIDAQSTASVDLGTAWRLVQTTGARPMPPYLVVAGVGFAPDSSGMPVADANQLSRTFATEVQANPLDFQAYAVIVFQRNPAADSERSKAMQICQEFVDTYQTVRTRIDQTGIEQKEQLVTVWPIRAEHGDQARELNDRTQGSYTDAERDSVCNAAIDSYDLLLAEKRKVAVNNVARESGDDDRLSGTGPFLFAWAPGADVGTSDAWVLVGDFSNAHNREEVRAIFDFWNNRIVQDPALWKRSWAADLTEIFRGLGSWLLIGGGSNAADE